jgi:phosphatidate cytidylyltransferase
MATRASNLALRLATAAVGLPIVIGVLYAAPAWGFYLVVLPAALVGVYELLTMTHPADPAARGLGVVISLAASLAVYAWTADSRVLLTVFLLVPLSGPLITLMRVGALETAALRACALGFAPLFVAVPLTLLAVMRRAFGQEAGAGAALLALGLAWFADTGAYFAGRFLGRHKLYEAVSPNKTVEGAIGGLLASVVWSLGASMSYLRHDLPPVPAVVLGLVAGALGQAGDLAESVIKRSTGVKDSGAIVPGHGGILDRVDAVLVTTVAVFLYMQWSHAWPR